MSAGELIGLVLAFVGLLITIISIAVKISGRVSVSESKIENNEKELCRVENFSKSEIKRIEDELKFHITMQEKSFSKLEDKIDQLSTQLGEILGWIKAQK